MPKIVDDDAVFRAAMQAVIERGYDGATTKQIATAAGISEVTLFRKYGSKGQLIKQAIAAQAARMDFESAAAYTGDAAADLLRVVELYQGAAEESGQFFYTVLTEIPRRPELAGLIDLPLAMFEGIGRTLTRYQSEGVLAEEPPLQAVAALLGPLMIANMVRSINAPGRLPPIDLPAHVARFLDGRRG